MNAAIGSDPLDTMSHEQIHTWLKRALSGQEQLPLLSPDEPPHLGVLRLEKRLTASARRSLDSSYLNLLREFCTSQAGEKDYLQELLFLAVKWKSDETVPLLKKMAYSFSRKSPLPVEIQQSVLAALVDSDPPQSVKFWDDIFQMNEENFAGMALAGFLVTDPMHAVKLLPNMPNDENIGQLSALQLDLKFDDIRGFDQSKFLEEITKMLGTLQRCKPLFAAPIEAWLISKGQPAAMKIAGLKRALSGYHGDSAAPRTYNAKLGTPPVQESTQ